MLSEALKLLRIFHEKSQSDLARDLGVAKSWISEIEAGKKTPTVPLLESYAKAFDIPLSSILFFSEEMKNGSLSERARMKVSKKILAMLNFISERANDEAAEKEAASS